MLQVPSDDLNKKRPTSHVFGAGQDQTGRSTQYMQGREYIQNRLRMKRVEIDERKRKMHELERAMAHLETEIGHAREDVRRVENEIRAVHDESKKEEAMSRQADSGMREREQQLYSQHEGETKIRHEIEMLKRQIEDKERALAALREDTRDIVKQKEDYRRTYEVEHFAASAKSRHAHEKELEAGRFKQEELRKSQDLERKKREHVQLKQEVLTLEGEAAKIESELRTAR